MIQKIYAFLLPMIILASGVTKINAQCSTYNRDVLLNPGTWTATASGGSGAANIIDGKIANGTIANNYWESDAANQYVQIDFGSSLDLAGVVYYPTVVDNTTVLGYAVEVSTDGSSWTSVTSGTIVNSAAKAIPTRINFSSTYTVRYLRFTAADSGKRIAELLPVVCNSNAAYPTIGVNGTWNFSTGAAGSASKKDTNQLDNNWEVAYITDPAGTTPNDKWKTSSPYNYSSTSALSFYPAIKVPQVGGWDNEGTNFGWLSATSSRTDILSNVSSTYNPAGNGDQNTYFYRYRFNIAHASLVNNIQLKFRIWSDNTIVRIYVNGTDQNFVPTVPPDSNHTIEREVTLENDFQTGVNEIMIQTYSEPPQHGFMLENLFNFIGDDLGDAPESYGTATAPSHIIETNAAGTQLLKMGSANTDAEGSGTGSINANTDNITGINDESGVVSFPTITSANVTSYSVNVTNITNNSGRDAYIVAWIDWNQNGSFDSEEKAVSTVIPTGSNNVSRTITWTSQTFTNTSNSTYARFRISSDPNFNTTATPTSYAKDGEVEDYRVTLTSACSTENQDVLLNPGTWTTTAYPGAVVVTQLTDSDVSSYLPSVGSNSYVQFDYATPLDLSGIVYYPDLSNNVTDYTVEVSADGNTWTTAASGTMPASTGTKAIPVRVNFFSTYTARYLRFTVANNGERVAELLPVVCTGDPSSATIDCENAWRFNSAASTPTSFKSGYKLDDNWEVAYKADPAGTLPNNKWTAGSPYDYATTATLEFNPAIAAPTYPGWANTGSNYRWISLTRDRADVISGTAGTYPGGGDQNTYFYRYRLKITDPSFADNLRIKLNIWVDNTVVRVYVNGVDQNITPGGDYSIGNPKYIELTSGFHTGVNEIMIQTYSEPGLQGIMLRNMTWCAGNDFGDASETYTTVAAPSHIIETNEAGTSQLLKMGVSNTDSETAGTASNNAKSDDNTGTDDETGVASFPFILSNNVASYTVNVTNVTNNSGRNAYIVSWIDWNQNGIYDAGEKAVSAVIPDGSNGITVPVIWNNQVLANTSDFTFARFRISSDAGFNTDATPSSYAKDGEVEDYFFMIKGCIKPGTPGAPGGFTKVGILTKPTITVSSWPESVPNGHIVMDSAEKGFVITHMTTAQRDNLVPIAGMMIYNTDLKCVQLYRGAAPGIDPSRTGWNCIERGCNE